MGDETKIETVVTRRDQFKFEIIASLKRAAEHRRAAGQAQIAADQWQRRADHLTHELGQIDVNREDTERRG